MLLEKDLGRFLPESQVLMWCLLELEEEGRTFPLVVMDVQ